ncbi:DUF4340 domain-containing protein [Paenibacillus aurantius]|uniref:DUF4340 domain-containing protein n=1 Tax=Paenibacillus aurantius TaxID=2918900 RepID=A0AA96LEC0_9BACL|nr:DUF4340 domain-containing protein [Paenibacillus aurantius]WNQ11644.1 DUF4340 domain-containing protein [Paenibacillus aurantius]
MKRLLPTLILVVLCIGGFWYASSKDYFKAPSDEASKQLLTLAEGDVQSLSYSDGQDAVEIARKDDTWEMKKPSPLPLNSYLVEGWIGTLSSMTYDSKVTDNAADLAEYGLAQPKQEYQVTLKDGSVRKLLVGRPMPVPGSSYVKLDNSPAVYEVSDTNLQNLAKAPLDFMDKQAVKVNVEKVKTVQFDWKGTSWKLEKAESDKSVFESTWKIGAKELKPEEGSGILTQLTNLSTEQLVKPASEVAVNAPELTIVVTEEDGGKTTSSTFHGKLDKDNVWIVKEGGAWAYSVPAASLQEIADKGKA